ncbi:MAG TPA: GNAT family N-acetyltransferase [Gaiellaceae bacterium]|nr:GNAT family N-acetyltransferase [Gaiellaceae bacterium]
MARPARREGPALTWVEVARTVEEVLALRQVWETLQTPFVTSDLEFVLAYLRNAAGAVRPHAVVLHDDDGPVALASCRVEDVPLPARLGPKTVLEPTVRSLTVTYGGLMGRVDETTAPQLLGALAGSVEPGEVDVVRLRMLDVDSPARTAALAGAPFFRREHFPTRMAHWRAEIPGSLDEFLARRSRRRRESVRRYAKRLERTYGDEARVEVFRTRDGIDRLFADSAHIHQETYQAVLGVGFSDERVQRALTELAMDRAWFRGYVLYLQEKPAAFWHGNAYRGVFGIGATGFDPAFADARPGTYLLMKAVEDLASDGSIHTLDFGFGDAEYKRHFGDECRWEEDVLLFQPRIRPLALGLTRTAFQGATKAARGAAERAGAVGRLRQRRRSRAAEQATR